MIHRSELPEVSREEHIETRRGAGDKKGFTASDGRFLQADEGGGDEENSADPRSSETFVLDIERERERWLSPCLK